MIPVLKNFPEIKKNKPAIYFQVFGTYTVLGGVPVQLKGGAVLLTQHIIFALKFHFMVTKWPIETGYN